MSLGYAQPLYILAFDHRGSMLRRFAWDAPATPEQVRTIERAKNLIYDGVLEAVAAGLPTGAGILVDEEFASSVTSRAHKDGIPLAVAAEASGRSLFEFAYPDWQRHIETSDPQFVKVLVRYNPGDPAADRRIQQDRLAQLSGYLRPTGRKLLLEMVVPATAEQLTAIGGDRERYADEVRPFLIATAIQQFQQAGVEADIWKIEGTDTRQGYRDIAAVARRDGRDDVGCLVLGAGAPAEQVNRWLTGAASVPGFTGFAVGRSIWWDEIGDWHAGRLDDAEAVRRIAANYRAMVEVFHGASIS